MVKFDTVAIDIFDNRCLLEMYINDPSQLEEWVRVSMDSPEFITFISDGINEIIDKRDVNVLRRNILISENAGTILIHVVAQGKTLGQLQRIHEAFIEGLGNVGVDVHPAANITSGIE